jgi:hypothetical protein
VLHALVLQRATQKKIQKNGPRATTTTQKTGKIAANGKIPATFSGK